MLSPRGPEEATEGRQLWVQEASPTSSRPRDQAWMTSSGPGPAGRHCACSLCRCIISCYSASLSPGDASLGPRQLLRGAAPCSGHARLGLGSPGLSGVDSAVCSIPRRVALRADTATPSACLKWGRTPQLSPGPAAPPWPCTGAGGCETGLPQTPASGDEAGGSIGTVAGLLQRDGTIRPAHGVK